MEFFGKKDISGKMISFFSSVMTNNKNIRLGIISGIKKLYDADLIPYHRGVPSAYGKFVSIRITNSRNINV
nr:hypothetical protein [Listeria monocytogenes]